MYGSTLDVYTKDYNWECDTYQIGCSHCGQN